MAWQNFIYSFLHAARDAGVANITAAGNFLGDNPRDFLVDDRAGSYTTFTGASSAHTITVDRLAGGTVEEINRLIIPEGHNANGFDLKVDCDSVSGFGSPDTILAQTAITSTAIIDLAMTGGTEANRKQRYVRIYFLGGSWNPQIPELIYTRDRTPSIGPEPGWGDMLRHNTLDFIKESGAIASISKGADRRLFEVEYRDVTAAADLLIFSELLAEVGTSKPFYLDPPFDTEVPIWVKLTEDSRQEQERAFPAGTTSARPRIRLSMLEHLA